MMPSSRTSRGGGDRLAGVLIFSLVSILVANWRRRLRRKPRLRVAVPPQHKESIVTTTSSNKSSSVQQTLKVENDPPSSPPPPLQLPSQVRQESVDNSDVERTVILLHNISHADMILSLSDDDTILARPKFSAFRSLSEKMYNIVKEMSEVSLVNYDVYQRDNSDAKRPIRDVVKNATVPVGINFKDVLDNDLLSLENTEQLKFRSTMKESMPVKPDDSQLKICGVFFPLLSALIPKWEQKITERCQYMPNQNNKFVIFLISGQGTPRDEKANVRDNSTEICALLMKLFLEKAYPFIEVQHIDSPHLNLFRYDENIQFVKQRLLPHVESIRSQIVDKVQDKWKDYMHLYISYASGSTARISAIGASLRPYKPAYMHFWQLKTFWNENKICTDDIEHHTYEEISTAPPIQIGSTNADVQLVVENMIKFKEEWEKMKYVDNDMKNFWLRKSRKPVLSVLLVQIGKEKKIYRGTNMEVSMPTGSLCAERNVIGTALAANLSLQRHHLKYIAVLSLSLDGSSSDVDQSLTTPSIDPKPNSNLHGLGYDLDCTENHTHVEKEAGPNILPLKMNKNVDPIHESPSPSNSKRNACPRPQLERLSTPLSPQRVVNVTKLNSSNSPKKIGSHTVSAQKTSRDGARSRIPSSQSFSKLHEPPSVHPVVVDGSDMNPLKPCGACHEWLKKFAEVNPSFSVITFTDSNFEGGIFVEQIEA